MANPAQLLDFRRFLSDELLACFREQRDALAELAPDVPVTTNLAFGAWVPVDPWMWAEEVDLVALDHYPSSSDGLDAEQQTAFAADLARGWAGGRPWLLMEQAPNLIYAGGRMLAKPPGMMTRLSLSHLARGSRGTMFFQWRAPRGGAEAFHSAMVPHAGPRTRVFGEVCELGTTLGRLAALDEARILAEVAIVWDTASWWALQGPGLPSTDLDYLRTVQAVHAALWRAGVTVDFVPPEGDVTPYRLVLAPALYLLSEEAADSLSSYVDDGGALAVWYFSGVADPENRIRLDGYAGGLSQVLGVRVEEVHPVPPDTTLTLSSRARARRWSELVRAEGAQAVAGYADGPLAGHPAITHNRYGEGQAWYVSTDLVEDDLDGLVRDLLATVGIGPSTAGAGHGVEVVRRRSSTQSWVVAINHTNRPAQVDVSGTDVITGETVAGVLHLAGGAYGVVWEGEASAA
jgi:beta-galactosidase